MKKSMKLSLVGAAITAGLLLTAGSCESNADQADANIKAAAENFEVQRTIVGISGNDGSVLFYAEGRCSFEYVTNFRTDVVCKYAPNEFRTHTFIRGERDSLTITQEESIDVSEYHTRIIIKPQSIIPDADIQVGAP